MRIKFAPRLSYGYVITFLYNVFKENCDSSGIRNSRACVAESLMCLMQERLITSREAYGMYWKFDKIEKERFEELKELKRL